MIERKSMKAGTNMYNIYNRSISFKVYFKSHILYKGRYYSKQTIFNQLSNMVSYVDIIGLCHSVTILRRIYVMRPKCYVRYLRFQFKQMLITGLGQ